jgi:iron-sulfur cluster assembly protein
MTLSPRAAKEIKRIMSEQELPDTAVLRVRVVGGGCSGFEYKLEFAKGADGDDVISESHGVRVVVDPKSAQKISGTEIDIQEGQDKQGFVFNNPLALRTCGCGTSVQV